jgi:hypothetical protein
MAQALGRKLFEVVDHHELPNEVADDFVQCVIDWLAMYASNG